MEQFFVVRRFFEMVMGHAPSTPDSSEAFILLFAAAFILSVVFGLAWILWIQPQLTGALEFEEQAKRVRRQYEKD